MYVAQPKISLCFSSVYRMFALLPSCMSNTDYRYSNFTAAHYSAVKLEKVILGNACWQSASTGNYLRPCRELSVSNINCSTLTVQRYLEHLQNRAALERDGIQEASIAQLSNAHRQTVRERESIADSERPTDARSDC